MRLLSFVIVVGLLTVHAYSQVDHLLGTQGVHGNEVEFSSITKTKPSSSASSHSSFGQLSDYSYRKAMRSAASEGSSTPGAHNDGKCIQFADDLCHLHNGDCASCLSIQGCGYCNDERQCLPSNGDNPAVEGCNCEVWLNEPKQCIEDVCAVVEGCSECSKKPYCVWCPEERLCMPGGFFGVSSGKNVDCKNWRWLKCEGMVGRTVIIITASSVAGILILFFATCVVYHKCYNPVRHSAHMHDELVESLLEDERTILSGHAHEVDPALDLKGDSRALNGNTLTMPREDVDDGASTADEMSQSEDDVAMSLDQ